MRKKSFFKDSTKLFIAVPILLLLFFLGFDTKKEVVATNEFEINPYISTMPIKYQNLIDFSSLNDSTFFVKIIDKPLFRELVVFKVFPTTNQVKTRFNIDVKLADAKKKTSPNSLKLEIRSEGSKFNYNNHAFAVFRHALPDTNIKSIKVTEVGASSKSKTWSNTIDTNLISEESNFSLVSRDNNSKLNTPSVFNGMLEKVLSHYNLKFNKAKYAIVNDSLYHITDQLNALVDKNNITTVTILKPKLFWNKINKADKNLLKDLKIQGKLSNELRERLKEKANNQFKLNEVFNLEKLAQMYAVREAFAMHCDEPLYFEYNPDSGLLEPYFVKSTCSGDLSKYVRKSNIKNTDFSRAYAIALKDISTLNLFEIIQEHKQNLQEEVATINQYYPNKIFDFDVLTLNQRVINKNITPSLAIKIELLSMNSNTMQLLVHNISKHPIQIKTLDYKKNKNIATLNPIPEVLYQNKDTISISLPRSFENLFVSKKTKTTGFRLFKDIYDLKIGYSISGIDDLQYASIIPYTLKEVVGEDVFRNPPSIFEDSNFTIDKTSKTITLSKNSISINHSVVFPEGYRFKLKEGESIDIVENGNIISHASFEFIGTKDKPIRIFSSDKKGEGLIAISNKQKSVLEYVVFDQLTHPKTQTWSVTGALTFYESNVDLNYVTISNNRCEDALNIVRSEFVLSNSTLENTQSDAFDGDFVKGKIINCKFINLGNDGIDVSGSHLEIINVSVSKAGDKGLSAGEDSVMLIDKVSITDSEIGIAGKDLSIITARRLKIKNTKLGFTAFQKKPEFGPSNIKVMGLDLETVETNYLIEESSTLIVNGKRIETSQNVKDRMYGVEFGVSSSETRGN